MKSRILNFLLIIIIANLVWLNIKSSKKNETVKTERIVETIADTKQFSRQNPITKAVEVIEPAVVSVNVIKSKVVRRYTNPFSNPFFGFHQSPYYRQDVKSIGTGIIVSEDGYIVTNSHVVEGATQIMVVLHDERKLAAELIAIENVQDIAILKVNENNLPKATLGSSKDLLIAESCIAVGNPYGLLLKDSRPSVSVGVISAVDRNFAEDSNGKIYKKMIQTDAAINPGNSGGPLVNIYGQVIGINTFILSDSGGSVGIGFAIPIDRVKKVINEVIEYGEIRQVWLGFRIDNISQLVAKYLQLNSLNGIIVTNVERNSPASNKGLKRGDVIVEINNQAVNNADEAELVVSDLAVGDKLKMKIIRDKKELEITIKALEYK